MRRGALDLRPRGVPAEDEPADNPPDVRVDRGDVIPERKVQDGRPGVRADAGQFRQEVWIRGERALVTFDNRFRALVEVHARRLVPSPPHNRKTSTRGAAASVVKRKFGQKPNVIRSHAFDPGPLQHHLRDQNPVRIGWPLTPG